MNIKTLGIGILTLSVIMLAGVSSGEPGGLFLEDDSDGFTGPGQASYPETDGCQDCDFRVQSAAYELKNTESALCFNCHDRVDEGAWTHGPVAVGECIICHDDFHGPENLDSLTRDSGRVCFKCHDKSRLDQHAIQMDSGNCVDCHDPHSSDDHRLLR